MAASGQIEVGASVPAVTVQIATEESARPVDQDTTEFFANSKVVIFSVPGAFTPTCSEKHLPTFVEQADALRAAGVDKIACVSVNDGFVMKAWGKQTGAIDKNIIMVADGSAKLAKALGLDLDLTERGLGVRMKRAALLVDNGVVKNVAVAAQDWEVTSAQAVLKWLAN